MSLPTRAMTKRMTAAGAKKKSYASLSSRENIPFVGVHAYVFCVRRTQDVGMMSK